MNDLIEKLKQIDELCLPNGCKGAVWLEDVIEVIENHYKWSRFDNKENDD